MQLRAHPINTSPRPDAATYVVGDDGGLLARTTSFVIEAGKQEAIRAFLSRLCATYLWHHGDKLAFVARDGKLTHVHVTRVGGTTVCASLSVSRPLYLAVLDLLQHGFGSTTFVINGDDVLIHDVTELAIRLEDGEDLAVRIAAVERWPGDTLSVKQQIARLTRRALPRACLALIAFDA